VARMRLTPRAAALANADAGDRARAN
jgi:hypothetical protein